MKDSCAPSQHGCKICQPDSPLDFEFDMALQPIVNFKNQSVFAHEALVRGVNGEGAGSVFQHVNDSNRYQFDQQCRVKAIELAAKLTLKDRISINFLPNAVYDPEKCLRTTLDAAIKNEFPIDNIIFEIAETEQIADTPRLKEIVDYYRESGFKVALDDFGSGYAGLNVLTKMELDYIKLDMELIRNIHQSKKKQDLVKFFVSFCQDYGQQLIAEGIETIEEFKCVEDLGVSLIQGFLFAKPEFQNTANIEWAAAQ